MRWQMILPIAAAVIGLLWLVTFEWGGDETLRIIAGAIFLWGPFALLMGLWLRPAVPDGGERLALSLAGSYAATALVFFGLSVYEIGWLFPWVQIAAVGLAVAYTPWRESMRASLPQWREWRWDWWLTALVIATLVVTVRYRVPFEFSPADGSRHFRLYHDQTYHAAMTYELQRHIPPLQRAIAAGSPERAYHLFPHISTLLLGTYGDQPDLLRTQTTWSFVVMTVILCLCLHFTVRAISGASPAGWLGVSLLFIFSIPFPPLIKNPLGYFYSSIYPHTTSLLEPVVMTTQQMYSGMVVFYGIVLGAVILDRLVVNGPHSGAWRVVAVLGIMTGTMIRFRAHAFLPLAPAFGLAGLWLAWRSRDCRHLIGVGLAAGISLALLAEMQRPIYAPGTASFSLGYNGLTWPGKPDAPNPRFVWWWMYWPGAEGFQAMLAQSLPEPVARHIWHVMGTIGFTLFQVVGIPLAAAAACTMKRDNRKRWPLFCGLMLWMTAASWLGAMYLDMGAQSYDLAGQMLLHICWYLFPALPIVLWSGFHWIANRPGWHPDRWMRPAVVAVCCGIVFQLARGPSSLETLCSNMGFRLSANEWDAFSFIRSESPRDAVVLMPIRPLRFLHPDDPLAEQRLISEIQNFAICSALGARNVFVESARNPTDLNRVRGIVKLWKTANPNDFASGLHATGADYMVEYPLDSPAVFQTGVPAFLRLAWESPSGPEQVRIWQIDRTRAAICAEQASKAEPNSGPSNQD